MCAFTCVCSVLDSLTTDPYDDWNQVFYPSTPASSTECQVQWFFSVCQHYYPSQHDSFRSSRWTFIFMNTIDVFLCSIITTLRNLYRCSQDQEQNRCIFSSVSFNGSSLVLDVLRKSYQPETRTKKFFN